MPRKAKPRVQSYETKTDDRTAITPVDHPLLRWCFSNAVVVRDAADNCKLDKSKAYGRIDVAVAAIMAVGALKATTATPAYDVQALIG